MTLRFSPQTRRVFHLSLPIIAELLLQLLVGNVDQFSDFFRCKRLF